MNGSQLVPRFTAPRQGSLVAPRPVAAGHVHAFSRRRVLQAVAGTAAAGAFLVRAQPPVPAAAVGRTAPDRAGIAPAAGEEVAFALSGGVTTHGVFDYPATGGPPFPAVLLLHGAGVYDRDSTDVGPDGAVLRPFVQIAEAMTAAGVAVFRYDKRGVRPPSELFDPAAFGAYTKPVSIDDAALAFARMVANPLVDAGRSAVLGISDGTWFAPHLPARYPQIRALALIGTGLGRNAVLNFTQVPLPLLGAARLDTNDDGALDESELLLDDPLRLARVIQLIRAQGQLFLLRYEGSGGALRPVGLNRRLDRNGDGKLDLLTEVRPAYEAFRAQFARPLALVRELADPGILPMAEPLFQRNEALEGALNESFADEPADGNLRALLAMPVRPRLLIVNGEHDDQTPASSAEHLVQGLTRAGYQPTFRIEPGLSHVLSPQEDMFAPYEFRLDPRALGEIAAWLAEALVRR